MGGVSNLWCQEKNRHFWTLPSVSVAQSDNGAEDTVRRCSEEHTQEPVYFFVFTCKENGEI